MYKEKEQTIHFVTFGPTKQEIMLGEGPHIHIPFSTKVVMFRRVFHFHSRPQTKDKPFPTKLGRGNYIGNYPPIGVAEGYRGCGSLC
jgi:hypothetical protein